MATVYYPSFDAVQIDADGVRTPAASKTIDVYNVTAASSLGTVSSNSSGIVAAGSFTATAGDVVEFSHATLPGTFRLTLAATQVEAYTIKGNNITSYVMENLATLNPSTVALLFAADTDNLDVEPVLIGSGLSGTTVEINYVSTVAKNLRIYARSQNDQEVAKTHFDTASYDDIAVPATGVSGVYTPTRSNEVNLDSNVTLTQAQYCRVGSVVTVSGMFTADPTTAATQTRFDMSLPVASNIGAIEDLAGTAVCGAIASMCGSIQGSASGDVARVLWIATDLTSQQWSYHFTYRVI